MRFLVLSLLLVGCVSHDAYNNSGQLLQETAARGDASVSICDGTATQTADGWICEGMLQQISGGTISQPFSDTLKALFAAPGIAFRAIFTGGVL